METKGRFLKKDDCDPTNPEEHFLWALTQVQVGGRETMPIQPNTARTISKHLYEMGFRHHPKLQTKKWQTATRGQSHALNGLARWVPMDAEDPEPLVLPDIKAMTSEEREWMHQELRSVGHITDPPPDRGPLAEVATWDGFQVIQQRATTAEEALEQ